MTNTEAKQALDGLQVAFPSGKYWQHDPSTANDWNSVLNSPYYHSTHSFYGTCACNSFYNSIQCAGFALYMAYRVFGHYPQIRMSQGVSNGAIDSNGWKYYTSGNFSSIDLSPGDIVYRLENNNVTHYAIIHYIDSAGNVYFGEALGSDNSRIAWGFINGGSQYRTVGDIKNYATCIMKAPKDSSSGGGGGSTEVTVYFKWNYTGAPSENAYVISYEPGLPYSQKGMPTPTREGYEFGGWCSDVEGTDIFPESHLVPYYSHDLYAKWIRKTIVRFMRNYSNSDNERSDIMYLVPGKRYSDHPGVSFYTPTREDYRFDGWFTDREGGTQHTLNTVVAGYDYDLYAHWTREYINISYYRNHSDSDTTVYVKKHSAGAVYGDSLISPGSIDGWEKDGYGFVGWYTDREGGTEHTEASIIKTYDHPLFARWAKQGLIHYMRNYTSTDDRDTIRLGLVGYPLNYYPMTNYDDYETSDAYYKFDGWYTSRSGGIKYTGDSLLPNTTELYLYAHWTRYAVVTFIENSDEDDPLISTMEYPVGGEVALVPAGCDGYRFDGWYDALVGGTRYYNGSIVPAVKNLTLYGHWTRIVSVSLNRNYSDSDIITYKTFNAYDGEAYGESLPASKVRSGYRFDGWFTARSGGKQVTAETLCSGADHTLYAHWTKVTAVVFSDNYSGNSVTVYCPANEKYGSVLNENIPVREGCTFDGWYKLPDSDSGHVYHHTIVPDEGTVVLYAHWTVKVTFNPCGGCMIGNPVRYYNVDRVFGSFPEVCCCEEEKYFDGWYTGRNGNGEKVHSLTVVPDYDMTLYANWRPEL